MAKASLGLALLLLHPLLAVAHADPHHLKRVHHEHVVNARQAANAAASAATSAATSSSSSASGSSSVSSSSSSAVTAAPGASGAPATGSLPNTLTATNPIIPPLSALTSGEPSQATPTFSATFTPGASPPVAGAPPLPTTTLDRSKYPPPTQVAPTDTPEVTQWLKELDGVQIPNIPINTNEADCSSNPEAAADPTRCWWTCGGCTRNTDIVTCPTKMDWGVSFDDGPSPYTSLVLDFLEQEKLDATFFVVGSSAYWLPTVLQAEYMAGHQIAVHTWFHQHLTTLSNEEIVAELGYTREIIKDVIGVTPKYMRPPYGDIDDRVRAISLAMGLQPIIWTRNPTTLDQFDTNDWKIPGGLSTGPSSFTQFQNILQNATMLNTGFIVLEHDLYQQTVDLAVGYTIPYAQQHQPPFSLKSINQCLGQAPADVYQETASNKTLLTLSTNWTGAFVDGIQPNSSSSNGTNSGSAGGGSNQVR
ncbi:carbohydrate esterase family 4 protein [Ramaria rubella]|nr:carbohydrate esterase family 4 protein [Ramaria rubella]